MSNSISKQRELLIELRSALVGSNHTLPFTIYNDDTIEDLLKAQPKSLDELVKVKGFPKNGKRVKGFGESIVEIFKGTNNIEGFNIKINKDKLEVSTKIKKSSVFK